jgi:hypothetical protein
VAIERSYFAWDGKNAMEVLLFPTFDSCHTCMVSFDLWMSRRIVDTFVLIAHFLNDKWKSYHIILGFKKNIDTFGNPMVLQVNDLLSKHGLNVCVIAWVKNEGGNLSSMIYVLTYVVFYEIFCLFTPFVQTCWGHVMFKNCQYATNDF